jgi:hypothetical protein
MTALRGFPLPRSTQYDWCAYGADKLAPIVAAMHAQGKKDIQIAAALGLTTPQARHIRQRMGLKSRYRQYLEKATPEHGDDAPFDADEVELRATVYGLHSDGFSVADIAIRVAKPVEVVEAIAADTPKKWKSWGKGNQQEFNIGLALRNQLRGSRRGGGKKMVPDDYRY